jgi:hypothetical protein
MDGCIILKIVRHIHASITNLVCSTMKCGVMKLGGFILLASQTKLLGIIFCDISVHPHVGVTLPCDFLGLSVFQYLQCEVCHYRQQYTPCFWRPPLPTSSRNCITLLHSLTTQMHPSSPRKSFLKGLYLLTANPEFSLVWACTENQRKQNSQKSITGVPPDPLIQYLWFQLSVVYQSPQTFEN